MKIRNFVLFALALTATGARAALYVSNLDDTASSIGTIDKDQWVASAFQTDNSAPSFTLENVVISLDGGDGTNQFSLALYEDDGNRPSATPYAILLGDDNPEGAGEYAYLPDGIVTLQPGTIYWVAARVGAGTGIYDWNATGAGTVQQWTIPNVVSFYQDDEWSGALPFGPQMFSVSASAVPEPSGSALAALGGFFALLRRHTMRAVPSRGPALTDRRRG